jgi:hypothetical protein
MGGQLNKLNKLVAPLLGGAAPAGTAVDKALETVGKLNPQLAELTTKTSPKQFNQLDEKINQARGTGRLALDSANAFLADPAKGATEFIAKTSIQP